MVLLLPPLTGPGASFGLTPTAMIEKVASTNFAHTTRRTQGVPGEPIRTADSCFWTQKDHNDERLQYTQA